MKGQGAGGRGRWGRVPLRRSQSADGRALRFPYARVFSSLFGFIAVMVVIYSGLPLVAPAYLILSIVALQEYAAMMKLRGIPIRRRSLYVVAVLTLPASLPVTYQGIIDMQPVFAGVSWRELLFGLFGLYLIALEVIRPNENSMNAVIYSLFGYFYIPWLLGYGITLRYTPDGVLGVWYLMIPILAIISSDVGAYIIGTLFGRRKLAPAISPNKTLEGAAGGLIMAVVIVTAATFALETLLHLRVDFYDAVLFSILVASAAQLGDLFESLIKRWAGVKDAGVLVPGHGGVLDRIDSFLFAVPVTYYFVMLVILR